MRTNFLWLIIIVIFVVSCKPLPLTLPTPTPTDVSKQGEPSRPLIGGQISSLPEGVLATINIRTPQDRIVSWGWAATDVPWQTIVHTAGGFDYYVTAEAEGYVSQPEGYMIHISGETAYLVRDGQVTDEEAIHLDFHFVPSQSP
ncbi:MAG: hypothetical protein U9R58_09555 [Chloroflexota bacterium]|nr:hypothetical protein [Chloroflexota bacterium]